MSGALRVKVFMMGGPMSVSPVAGGDFSVSQVLGDQSGRGMSSGPGGSSRRRSTNEGQRGGGDVRDEEQGELTEESRQSSSTGRSQGLDDRLGIRGGDGGGGGPAGEQGGLQFHVPIQSVPVSPWHGVPISRRLSIAVKLGGAWGALGSGKSRRANGRFTRPRSGGEVGRAGAHRGFRRKPPQCPATPRSSNDPHRPPGSTNHHRQLACEPVSATRPTGMGCPRQRRGTGGVCGAFPRLIGCRVGATSSPLHHPKA